MIAGDVEACKLQKSRTFRPTKQMKKLNWTKLPERTIKSTTTKNVWKKATGSLLKIDIKVDQLVEMFSRDNPKKESEKEEKKTSSKPKKVSLLDQKTNLNVNIFLKQFKTTNEAIVKIVQDGDAGRISGEQVKSLIKLLPDSGTIEQLQEYKGDPALLGTAEDFYLKLVATPGYPLRLTVLQLRLEFGERIDDIEPALKLFQQSIQEVLDSNLLDKLLYVVLMTGNHINGGTYGGGAYGFTVESLAKLRDTKGNNPRMTVLHYVVELCETQEEDLLSVSKELPHLESASRLQFEYLTGQVADLKRQVNDLDKKKASAPEDLAGQIEDFLSKAQPRIEDLQALVDDIQAKSSEMAEYFVVDKGKYKLEEVLVNLNSFVKSIDEAKKVMLSV